jgi:hypothetical protein
MLDDDEESKTIVVTRPGRQFQQPAPNILEEEDTQTTMPVASAPAEPMTAPEPAPAGEQEEDATKTFVAPITPKAKRSRQKRATTGEIVTAPVADALETAPVAPAIPDDLSEAQNQDEHIPFSTSSPWMDTLQEHQEAPDDIPEWLSSLQMVSQQTEATAPVEASEAAKTDLQQPVTGEEKSSVTNDTSNTLQHVEEPSAAVEHQSSSIQSKDGNDMSQDE